MQFRTGLIFGCSRVACVPRFRRDRLLLPNVIPGCHSTSHSRHHLLPAKKCTVHQWNFGLLDCRTVYWHGFPPLLSPPVQLLPLLLPYHQSRSSIEGNFGVRAQKWRRTTKCNTSVVQRWHPNHFILAVLVAHSNVDWLRQTDGNRQLPNTTHCCTLVCLCLCYG